jgi:cytoskeletal protein CcmA (bactofilin family)
MSLFGNKNEHQVEESAKQTNAIAKGTTITGDIETFGSLRLDGKLIGNINSGSKVILGPTAVVEGHITAKVAEIEGEVHGKVLVKDTLTLRNTSRVHGDIFTGKLNVEVGARFNGNCQMGENLNGLVVNKNGVIEEQGLKPQKLEQNNKQKATA